LFQFNYLFSFRMIWREIATWTGGYLISRVAGLPNAEDLFRRLYRIPQDFGKILVLIFGYEKTQPYIQNLSQQLVLIRTLIEAELSGDVQLIDQTAQQLYQLADERAEYLASLNPFWRVIEWQNLTYTFLQLNFEMIVAFLSGEYQRSINVFDRLLYHADSIGDYFAEGMYNYLIYRPNRPVSSTETAV